MKAGMFSTRTAILSKMIIVEILPPFILAFSAISAFMLLGRMMILLQPLLMAGISIFEFLRFTAIILPSFFGFSIPIAVLLGNLLAFMRLARDSEIIALICCGVDFRRIIRPVALFTIILWVISLFVTIVVVPHSKTASKAFLREITEKILARGLPERTFFNPMRGLTFYVDRSSDDRKKFKGVFISDQRKDGLANNILARNGTLVPDETGSSAVLVLNSGVMTIVDSDQSSMDYLHFDKYVLKLRLPEDSGRRSRGQMSIPELYKMAYEGGARPDRRIDYRIELQKRFAIPCGVLILGLMAVPLGCLFGRSGLSGGVAIGLAAFLCYYVLMELCANISKNGIVPPEAAMWLPNVAGAVAVMFLMRKMISMEGGRR